MNPRSFSLSTWKAAAVLAALVLFVPVAASGQLTIPSDGSDGAFNPTANTTVDLSQAITGTWNQPGTGAGVYDPSKWAVVFKYSEVNIPSGVTVSFTNHPSGAPVVWLVQNNVTVAGSVNLNGENASPHQGIPSRAGREASAADLAPSCRRPRRADTGRAAAPIMREPEATEPAA